MHTTVLFEPVLADLEKVEAILSDIARVEHQGLAFLLEHLMRSKGKRIRPAIVLLAAKFGDYPLDRLAPVAAAVELLHTASLVHDDVIDDAAVRRGNPTLNAIAGSRAPILVGDFIFAKSAHTAVMGRDLRVMDSFAATLMEICDGELREVLSVRQWPQTVDDYYQKIACKTASLFRLSAECGAILSGRDDAFMSTLSRYGRTLGMAFQVVDDILDFTAEEKELGKPVGGDLRQGTITLPILYYLDGSSDGLVTNILSGAVRDEGALHEAIELIVASPAIDRCYAVANEFAQQAIDALQDLPDNTYRQALVGLASYIVGRVA